MMDQPCSYEDLRDCLSSLSSVNRLTLAHRPTLIWLEKLRRANAFDRQTIHILDVGCGYGDLLRRIHRWAKVHNVSVTLTGVDLNSDAIRAAREATPEGVATFHAGNAFAYASPEGIDLIVSSMVMHHLEDAAIVEFLAWLEATARIGWFISDLHRQPVPYRLFRLLTRFTTWHRFTKHDGAISILRSFRHQDWRTLLRSANIPVDCYRLEEFRPARLCVARER